jgi:hypothetical protein
VRNGCGTADWCDIAQIRSLLGGFRVRTTKGEVLWISIELFHFWVFARAALELAPPNAINWRARRCLRYCARL